MVGIILSLWKSLKVMINNYTNSNKMNNRPTSYQIIGTKQTTTYDFWKPGPGLGQANQMTGLNRLTGTQRSPLDNWISNGNTYKQTIKKTCLFCFYPNRLYITQKNERQHEHGQYNSRVHKCSGAVYVWLISKPFNNLYSVH